MIQTSRFAEAVAGGDYSRVVEAAFDQGTARVAADDLPWVLASLCWVGRSTEADGIWQARQADLTGEAAVAARFFVAVAACREGKHEKAKQLFIKNLGEAPGAGGLAPFFAAQGLAFFRYATGRLGKAQLWAERALKAAAGMDFAFGRVLASELLGHAQLCRGQVRAGFRSLKMAVGGAERLGQGALLQMMKTSETLYRSTFGQALNAEAQAAELQNAMSQCRYEDTYTKASLMIELTRVRMLQGQLGEAQQLLESAADLVYRIDNPDLELEHNLCIVGLLRRRGDLFQALTLIRSCNHRAKARLDVRVQLKVLGAEMALLGELGRIDEQAERARHVAPLTLACDSLVARRMLARSKGEPPPAVRPGEDPIGDLIDQVRSGIDAVGPVIQRGWLGLLPAALGLEASAELLYLDLEPGSLTVFDRGEVRHVANGCSDLIRKLLLALGSGDASKESLTMALWGREYHPLRHDALIYGLVAKTRKLLAASGAWIESVESGYRLRPGTRVQVRKAVVAAPAHPPLEAPSLGHDLNYRQNVIYTWLASGEVLEARTVTDRLEISDATASRDLAGLVERGLAHRLGKGKATKYRASAAESSQS